MTSSDDSVEPMSLDRAPADRRRAAPALAALLIAVTGPVWWALLRSAHHSSGDVALIELQVRDVLSGEPPLVGAYSRYGWSHPGPLALYLFALPTRLLGSDSDALRITVLLGNAVMVCLIVWLASRRSRTATVGATIAIVGVVWGLQTQALADGWNVTVAMLPLLLVIVACWCAVAGDRVAMIVALPAFSFVFQSHAGFGVVVAPLVAGTVVWCAVAARRSRDVRVARAGAIATGALFVTVVPLLYDTVTRWPGNVGRLISWSLRNDEPAVGMIDAVQVLGRASSLTFLWSPQPSTFFFTVDTGDLGLLPGSVVVLLAGSLALAHRRRWRDEALLCAVLLVVWASGVAAAASIARPLEVWLVQWTRPLAWTSWAAVAVVGWRWLQGMVSSRADDPSTAVAHRRRVAAAVWLVGGAAAVAGTVWYAVSTVSGDPSVERRSEVVATLAAAAASVTSELPVRIDADGDRLEASIIIAGVVNELDRRGIDACVDASFEFQYGSRRVCAPATRPHLVLRSESQALEPPAGTVELEIVDHLSPPQRAEADALTRRLTDLLRAEGLDELLPLLDTPSVIALLDDQPRASIVAAADAIERLHHLRRLGGERYGLYLVTG